jgi:hypothetical protein
MSEEINVLLKKVTSSCKTLNVKVPGGVPYFKRYGQNAAI